MIDVQFRRYKPYLKRMRYIKNRVKTLHKIVLAFNMTLAEFLDFDELNDYSFDDDSDDE